MSNRADGYRQYPHGHTVIVGIVVITINIYHQVLVICCNDFIIYFNLLIIGNFSADLVYQQSEIL